MDNTEKKYALRHTGAPRRMAVSRSQFGWLGVLLLAAIAQVVAAQPKLQTPAAADRRASPTLQPTAAGVIQPASTQPAGSAALGEAFRRADRNGDGRLSQQEAEHFPALAERFEQFDVNRDGQLSMEEFERAGRD